MHGETWRRIKPAEVSYLTGKKFRDINLAEFRYTAPSGTVESVEFQIVQARFMLEQMRRFERDFQRAADKGERRTAFKARDKYIFHFLAFLSATRIAIYYMIAAVKHDRGLKAWFMTRTSTIIFKVFREVRGFATHEQPLRFSLNYNITGSAVQDMRGLIPSRINVDIGQFAVLSAPPTIGLDVGHLPAARKTEFLFYVGGDERRKSLTSMCDEFLDEVEAVLRAGAAQKHF